MSELFLKNTIILIHLRYDSVVKNTLHVFRIYGRALSIISPAVNKDTQSVTKISFPSTVQCAKTMRTLLLWDLIQSEHEGYDNFCNLTLLVKGMCWVQYKFKFYNK